LIETDLNGPEFVGTAEYMSPYTVRSKPVGIDADLWALGVLLYQLLVGYTPFNAPSPYLSFLRIQRGLFKVRPSVTYLLHAFTII
jgi:serine/threonine protein kinase